MFSFEHMLASLGDPIRRDCPNDVYYWPCMNGSLGARSKRSKSIGQDSYSWSSASHYEGLGVCSAESIKTILNCHFKELGMSYFL